MGLLVGLPIPRKQVGDLAGGMIRQSGQDVGEPGLGIDVVHLAGLCRVRHKQVSIRDATVAQCSAPPSEPADNAFFQQGCSTLFTESHGKDGFETAECCGVAVLGDRIGLVDPQDIVGEAAHSCEDAGIFSDTRRVFT